MLTAGFCYFKCVSAALKYALKRMGVTPEQRKHLSFALRVAGVYRYARPAVDGLALDQSSHGVLRCCHLELYTHFPFADLLKEVDDPKKALRLASSWRPIQHHALRMVDPKLPSFH